MKLGRMLLLTAVLLAASCARSEFIGPGAHVDLAVFVEASVSAAELNDVYEHVTVPLEGSQFDLLDQVQGVSVNYSDRALYLDFVGGTTEEEIVEIEDLFRADPLVVRIERDYVIDDS